MKHNDVRDRLAKEYGTLPPLTCRFCQSCVPLPTSEIISKEFRYTDSGLGVVFIADVAALDEDGNPVAVIEVIASHKPRDEVLKAQAALPSAFYVDIDPFADGAFMGWCSSWCWRNKDEERVSQLLRCDICDTFLPQSVVTFHDWSGDPNTTHCLHCAAAVPGTPQWNDPGRVAFGDAGILPPIPGPAEDIFLTWSTAAFWSMVWNERARTPGEAHVDESVTAKQLDEIDKAFERDDWATGAALLQPIGNRWLQDEGGMLWAWDPENCRRVARSWSRLHAYLLSSLPVDIREIILARPTIDESSTGVPSTELTTEIDRGEADLEEANLTAIAHLRQDEDDEWRKAEQERRAAEKEEWARFNDWFRERSSGTQ